jgi:CheY-like chemotaxis protein
MTGARILAVDDTAASLELITYVLQACGHVVYPARNGAQALAAARRETPDLIVVDLQLPDMDGFAVLRELRTDPALAATPVVAVTAYAMVGDRDHALACGFDGYIAKPLDLSTFFRDIDQQLPEALRGGAPRSRRVRDH